MKIEKQFVSLILKGTKQYEFRSSDEFEGIYCIFKKYFQLVRTDTITNPSITISFDIENKPIYTLDKYEISEEEFSWFTKNHKKWIGRDKKIYVYEWIEVDLKKIQVVDDEQL